MFLKDVTRDAADNKTPKILVAGTAIFMALLTITLLYVGGYDAMETSILCWGLPSSALIILFTISSFKFLLNRKKYDVTYQEELEESGQSEAAGCEEIPFPADEEEAVEAPVAEA